MRLDHLLSKDSDEPTVHNLRSVIWLSFALSSFEGASDARDCVVVTSLFTENCTEETRKSNKGKRSVLMYVTFSTLKDFPKQIRIKRKYLLSQDDDFREKS